MRLNIDERRLAIEDAAEEAVEKASKGFIAQGRKLGVRQGILRTAKSMLADGLGLARVARITKLPKEQIMALR